MRVGFRIDGDARQQVWQTLGMTGYRGQQSGAKDADVCHGGVSENASRSNVRKDPHSEIQAHEACLGISRNIRSRHTESLQTAPSNDPGRIRLSCPKCSDHAFLPDAK